MMCTTGLGCNDIERWDDTCFPQALAAVAPEGLPAGLLETCSADTGECKRRVAEEGAGEAGLVSACLERWVSCETEYYPDFCLSLMALEFTEGATGCIDQPCNLVKTCLSELGAFGW